MFNHLLEKIRPLTRLKSGGSFRGVSGSAKPFLVALQSQQSNQPCLIVTESFEKAEQWMEDLKFFLGEDGLYFFPHWDTLPYDTFSPHRGLVAQRVAALDAVLCEKAKIVVTTPNAMMQRLLPRSGFEESCFSFKINHFYSRETVIQQLKEAGYSLVDQVEEPGEYSIRQHLLDLFPVQSPLPYRIHWEDSQPVKIFHFSPETQRSLEDPLDGCVVLPAQEVLLNQESCQQALKALSAFSTQISRALYDQLRDHLRNQQAFPGMESKLSLFAPRLETLLDYGMGTYRLILDEPSLIQERSHHFYDEILMEYEVCREQGELALNPESLFLHPKSLQELFSQQHPVELYETIPEGKNHSIHTQIECGLLDNRSLHQSLGTLEVFQNRSHQILHQIEAWRQQGIPVFLNSRSQTSSDQFQKWLTENKVSASLILLPSDQTGWLPILPSILHEPIPILVSPLSGGFRLISDEGQLLFVLLSDEEIFGEKWHNRHQQLSQNHVFMKAFDDLQEGDHVVHIDYGIGQYQGLQKIEAGGQCHDFMVLIYARDEKVYVPVDKFHLVQKYINIDGSAPKLSKLGEKSWKTTTSKVAKSVEDLSKELSTIYAARHTQQGFRYSPDSAEMREFELAFPYEETRDQLRAIEEIKADMESASPMDRLVCGDVGFGKTEVAMRAAYKASLDGKQVAVLVPTTILAQQHWLTFQKRFQNTAARIEMINRFRSPAEQKETIQATAEGSVDILVGTHRLLSNDIQFKDLGLLIIDEEQRFGVKHKEKIKQFRAQIDVLVLSATPVPRTLYMSLMKVRDLSTIATPPADRMAIRTRLLKSSDYILQEAVSRELRRGGQVFIVHNRVESIYEYATYLKQILPNIKIGVGHGQLAEHQLEEIMMDFIEGRYDVLLATTIIESGLDIPRANTIIINHAEQFGLSQLYQLRGRVGRSNIQAYAYLLVPPDKILTQIAQERLKVLQEFNDLGSGFKIASRDLELRGAGNLLGSEQSGHISSVGLEFYTLMVEAAVKRQQGVSSWDSLMEIKIHLDINPIIPETYIASTNHRLALYKKLSSLQTEDELWNLQQEIEDRFGVLPDTVIQLFKKNQIRLLAQGHQLKLVEHRQNQLKIELAHTDNLSPESLVVLLQQSNGRIQFVPDATLIVKQIPKSLDLILDQLQTVLAILQ